MSEDFAEGRRLYYYDKGEEIPLSHQGVWQVYRGVIQLSRFNPNGEEVLLGWAMPLTYFGNWFSCLNTYYAKALADVYLNWYSLGEIDESPLLAQNILHQVVHRIRQTEALLAISGLRRVEERLTELLFLLKNEMGEPHPLGTRIKVRFTHQNLANTIATTRVTVTRLLGDFQRQGFVSMDNDRHIILLHDK